MREKKTITTEYYTFKSVERLGLSYISLKEVESFIYIYLTKIVTKQVVVLKILVRNAA